MRPAIARARAATAGPPEIDAVAAIRAQRGIRRGIDVVGDVRLLFLLLAGPSHLESAATPDAATQGHPSFPVLDLTKRTPGRDRRRAEEARSGSEVAAVIAGIEAVADVLCLDEMDLQDAAAGPA